jgi:hypothetical protein
MLKMSRGMWRRDPGVETLSGSKNGIELDRSLVRKAT